MIKYTLNCDNSHSFEGWFRNSDDFDMQAERGFIACPVCGSDQVQKSLMAPAVSTSRSKAAPPPEPAETGSGSDGQTGAADVPAAEQPAESRQEQQTALISNDERHQELVSKLRELRQHMTENADYVGNNFAEEARKMHYGEKEGRSIYGETSQEDAKSLIEDGVAVLPLPTVPEDHN